MVIDTSALVAILQNEPERRSFNKAIEAAETPSMSTASFVETSLNSTASLTSDVIAHIINHHEQNHIRHR